MSSSKKLYGIIGYPLGHSLSPLLHNQAFSDHSFPGQYTKWEIKPEDLPLFIKRVRKQPVSGLSVTIPYKQSVIPFLDALTPLARTAGAVNTVFWDQDKLTGDNTDIAGFLSPLFTLPQFPNSALVLGTGGAALAVLTALFGQHCRLILSGRNRQAGETMAKKFHAEFLPWKDRFKASAELLVNTTPLGMTGALVHENPWPADMNRFQLAYDLIYTPDKTKFLTTAEQARCRILNGRNMFITQAARQFYLWTGLEMDEKKAFQLVHYATCKE